MQSSIHRTSPFYNSRNHEKPPRLISAKQQRPADTTSAKNTRNLRDYDSIKTLYRKPNQVVEPVPVSRPSTYTKETNELEITTNSAGDNNESRDSVGFLFERRNLPKPLADIKPIKNTNSKTFPNIVERPQHFIPQKLPNSARSSTPYPHSSILQKNARKQIRANLELYFRKKELAHRYSNLRPSSASSVKNRYESPRGFSQNPGIQRHITAPGIAMEKPPIEPLTVFGSHVSSPKLQRSLVKENRLTNSNITQVTALSSEEYFDCQKVCSVESYKLVAEKDTNQSSNIPKPTKGARKTPSKSRINTHWSFGPPSDTLEVPFQDSSKLISLDPIFLASPRRKANTSSYQRSRLLNRCKRPISKTMTTTMMIPR